MFYTCSSLSASLREVTELSPLLASPTSSECVDQSLCAYKMVRLEPTQARETFTELWLKDDWHEMRIFCPSTYVSIFMKYSFYIRDMVVYLRTLLYIQWLFQPIQGPGLLFSSLIIFHSGRTAWASDQLVARPLPKHRTTQTQNKRIPTPNIHALSGIRTHDPSVRASEDSSCLRPRVHCDRLFILCSS
jgi:hypothetical protein